MQKSMTRQDLVDRYQIHLYVVSDSLGVNIWTLCQTYLQIPFISYAKFIVLVLFPAWNGYWNGTGRMRRGRGLWECGRTGETVAMVGGFARRQVFMVETRINTRFGAGSWSHDLTMSWKFLLANTNSHHKTSLPAQTQATRVRASCDHRPPIHALLSLFIRLARSRRRP